MDRKLARKINIPPDWKIAHMFFMVYSVCLPPAVVFNESCFWFAPQKIYISGDCGKFENKQFGVAASATPVWLPPSYEGLFHRQPASASYCYFRLNGKTPTAELTLRKIGGGYVSILFHRTIRSRSSIFIYVFFVIFNIIHY